MSTGTPSDPVCQNVTAALIASPTGVNAASTPIDPVCRAFANGSTQTAVPPAPPSR